MQFIRNYFAHLVCHLGETMTQAVMTMIVILAILLSLHIFIIVWLLWQQRKKTVDSR